MSYRFSNKDEKSGNQLFYEWLETKPLGSEIDILSVPHEELGMKRSVVSASCTFFAEHGVLKAIGKKQSTKRGRGSAKVVFETKVYKFIKKYDGRFKHKPKETTRNRPKSIKQNREELYNLPLIGDAVPRAEKKKPKISVNLSGQQIVDLLINAAVYVEQLLEENKRLRKVIDEKI